MDARDRHLHWDVFAYDDADQTSTSGIVRNGVLITVIGYSSEADAIAGAQELVVRQQYRVQRVWECNVCAYQQNMTSALSKAL